MSPLFQLAYGYDYEFMTYDQIKSCEIKLCDRVHNRKKINLKFGANSKIGSSGKNIVKNK